MDLFQTALLGLLALGVVVLIALLATLIGIKRAVEESANSVQLGPATGTASAHEPSSGGFAAATEAGRAAETSGAGAASAEPTTDRDWAYASVEQEPVQTATPASSGASAGAAATGAGQPAATGPAATIRSVLEQHGLAETGSPGATHGQAQPHLGAQEPVVDSVFAAHADDPQEEPFQRDGRWWFRRGDEVLLYDEATGQWQPAPEVALPGQPARTGAPQQAGHETAAATAPMTTVAGQGASFWKCPTCGAVNGSTAPTCRMCFAARP